MSAADFLQPTVFSLLAALTLLPGCGGGDEDGGDTNPTAPNQLRVIALDEPRSYQLLRPGSGNQIFLSAPVSFTIPSDAVSFQIYARTQVGNSLNACLTRVMDPDNVDVLAIGARSILDADIDYCGVLVPQAPHFTAKAGVWRYSILADDEVPNDLRVTLALRTGPLPSGASTLTVQPFLASGAFTAADIRPVLAEMRRIYEQAGITLRIAKTVVLHEPAFRIVSPQFTGPFTRQLVSRGRPGVANLFFVDDFVGGSGVLGIAPGIPGSLGVAGHRNGVLISLNAALDGNQQLDLNLLGKVAGHELGHFVGLFHTTEFDGLVFDILNDTPMCKREPRDANNDRFLLASECRGLDANNLMFWAKDDTIRQTGITADQAYVIRVSPIADVN